MTDIYIKVGKRYKKIGHQFIGFPANGIWLVQDGRNNLIMKVGDLLDPMPLAQMCLYDDIATAAMLEISREPHSIYDLWRAAIMAIAKEIEKDLTKIDNLSF